MSTTTNMIAPSPGQTFTGNPSGATYTADSSAAVQGVAAMDVMALVMAGCKFQLATTPLIAVPASGATYPLAFPSSGNITYRVTLSAACAFSIAAGTSGYQEMTLEIIPAGNQATLPAEGVVTYTGAAAPVPSASSETMFKFSSDGSGTILGNIP
jgi:hypothetical protein